MRDNALLLERVRNGDMEARDLLVSENMGLVYSVVKRFSSRGEVEDLTQVGAIGLIKAVKKFDPGYNVQFSTYAVPMITGEIRRYLRDDGAVKISRTLKEKAMKGKRCEEILRRRLNREPTIGEVAKESGIPTEELLEAFEAAAPPESIYESVYSNGEKEIQLVDMLDGGSIEDDIINRVLLNGILETLKPKEKQVIVLRYLKGKTQTEISKIIGVSQVQVSRIEKKAIEKLAYEVR